MGGDELISGQWRWCLWLKDASPTDLAGSPAIRERLDRVRAGRLKSPTPSVKKFAQFPALFTQDRQPSSEYLAIPEVSSERRFYIPMAILPADIIASNKLQIIPGAGLHLFALLTSAMHMGWMRTVAGRLESRYSYSPTVYFSFPFPILDDKNVEALCKSAQRILDVRASFPNETLERLYDPETMPASLVQAHQHNDRVVDRLYAKSKFDSEHSRVKHLFQLYETHTSPIEAIAATAKRKKSAAGKAVPRRKG